MTGFMSFCSRSVPPRNFHGIIGTLLSSLRDRMIGAYQIFKTDAFAADRGAFPEWLASQLRDRGVHTAKIVTESFGWSMKLRGSPYGLRVECGSRNESGTEWGAYVVAQATILERMFRRVAVRREIDRVTKVLEQTVQAVPQPAPR